MDLRETLDMGESINNVHGDVAGTPRKIVKVYDALLDYKGVRKELLDVSEELRSAKDKIKELQDKLKSRNGDRRETQDRYSKDRPPSRSEKSGQRGNKEQKDVVPKGFCRLYNTHGGCDRKVCYFSHKCSHMKTDGTLCQKDHPVKDHV